MITKIKDQIDTIAPGSVNDYSYDYRFVVASREDNHH